MTSRNNDHDDSGRPRFTLSPASSVASSRESSPAPISRLRPPSSMAELEDDKQEKELTWVGSNDLPGLKSTDVYETTLPWWRAAIRRQIIKNVRWESDVIATIQDYIRAPWLDAYFVYTSSLGTHTFFMIMLPIMFFFGYDELGIELVTVLAAGVYFSSFIKDLICSPRPFAPPVTRLTIGTHHLEYGFPSTHSTNSVSMALFFYAIVHRLATPPSPEAEPFLSHSAYVGSTALLGLYAFSIVFGRIYTAMHSFIDCIAGSLLGASIWWAQTSFPGFKLLLPSGSILAQLASVARVGASTESGDHLVYLFAGLRLGERLEYLITHGSYKFPLVLMPLFFLSVNQHPQPVDDCPCFEDAIAFISVVFGCLTARWTMRDWKTSTFHTHSVMPGSGWMFDHIDNVWVAVDINVGEALIWWSVAFVKVVVGILAIFMWRLLAKSLLHVMLPPIFRFLSRLVSLPNRRFYTPATDYTSVPSEFSGVHGGGDALGRAVPSVIDLPAMVEIGEEQGTGANGKPANGSTRGEGGEGVRVRFNAVSNGGGEDGEKVSLPSPLGLHGDGLDERDGEREVKDKFGEPVKHYDADVITKMIVYAGIAIISWMDVFAPSEACDVDVDWLPPLPTGLEWFLRNSKVRSVERVTMKTLALILSLPFVASALTVFQGTPPNLTRQPFGYAALSTGGSTNTTATYVVSNASELREALALPFAKTIYVNGTIQGNQMANGNALPLASYNPWHNVYETVLLVGTLATCQSYIDMTGSPGSAVHGFNFELYLLSLNSTYLALVTEAAAANTTFEGRNATEYRTLLGHQNGYRPVVSATQKAQVGFRLTNNTSLIGLDEHATLDGINLYLSSVNNVWIRNLKLVPPQDCFPSPETFPSSWNALYDAVGLVTATNVWVDGCELQDQISGEYVEPEIIAPGWQVDRFDGLFDCEDGTDNVTFSHNIVRNHHKSLLLGGGSKEADRDLGKMHFTIFGNHFNGSASRNPLMRFGTFDILSNIFENRNDKKPRFETSEVTRRSSLDDVPLDAVFQYHLGIYNQSRVQVQENVFLQDGEFPNDTSRIFSISEATRSDIPAKLCIRESTPNFPSTLNGAIPLNLTHIAGQTVDFVVQSGTAVAGAVVLTCEGFEQHNPRSFSGPDEVLEYVLKESGVTAATRRVWSRTVMSNHASMRVSTNPELMSKVLQYPSTKDNLTSNLVVCKLWSNEVLNAEWSVVDHPLRLFKLLAPLLKDAKGLHAFSRSLRPSDWEKFDRYAWRVRELNTINWPGYFKSSVYYEIGISRQRLALLPNVRRIYCFGDPNILQLFGHSSVVHLVLHGRDYTRHGARAGFLALYNIPMRMTSLHQLYINLPNPHTEADFKELESVLISVFSRTRKLRSLTITPNWLTAPVCAVLSDLPDLAELDALSLDGNTFGASSGLTLSQLGSDNFPSLDALSLVMTFRHAIAFFDRQRRDISSLRLVSKTHESVCDYSHLLSVVRSGLPHLKTFVLKASSLPASSNPSDPMSSFTFDSFRPLLSCKLLEKLVLTHPLQFQLTKDDIYSIVEGLPFLTKLSLNPNPAISHLSMCFQPSSALSSLHISCLSIFADSLPFLEELSLFMDTSHEGIPTRDEGLGFRRLRLLSVGKSPLAGNAIIPTATYLGHLLPKWCTIHHAHENAMNPMFEPWQQAFSLVPAFIQTLEDGQDRVRARQRW
ncbi:hypothetical protein ONZ45_g8224 [Pleurotus djamor]|nr:hypothetical protein ONZ45_g8224 [Pleurotus djamor]